MNLRDLKYLVAVAEHRHFGKAADACYVSQPTLSTQIKKLEEELGVVLLERTNRQVMLTPVGERIVAQAQRVLREVDDLVHTADEFRDPFGGEFRLGLIPTVAPYLLPRVLPAVRRKHRELRPLLREDQTDRLVEALEAGRLDLLLLALEADLGGTETLPLFRDDFVAVMPADHPLAKRKTLSESDLSGQTVLLLDDGH